MSERASGRQASPSPTRRRAPALPGSPACCAARRCAIRCSSSCSRRCGRSSTFATDGTFLTQRNLVLLALQTSIVSLAAISAVMLIVTRNFDLSVGSAVALVGVVLALLTVKNDVNPIVAVAVSVAGRDR